MKHFLLIFMMLLSNLQAGWMTQMGEIQQHDVVQQSYLKGLLTRNTYGIYRINSDVDFDLLRRLYRENGYRLFWEGKRGSINALLTWIDRSEQEGLNPRRYHQKQIRSLSTALFEERFTNPRDRNLALVSLDILLSDAFLGLSHDLNEGLIEYRKFQAILANRSKREQIDYKWAVAPPKYDYTKLMLETLNAGNISEKLKMLVGQNEVYRGLTKAYRKYLRIRREGGWETIPSGKALRKGMQGPRVDLLARRLSITGDLDPYHTDYLYFDARLFRALKKFQRRHDIWPSGVMTEETRRALNVPVSKRLAQIKLNLEHSRWEKESYGNEYIWINIPDFMMYFFSGRRVALKMRVIVGRKKNPTPVFTSKMSYVVLNPYWSVPSSIVKKEMLPRLQEDPDYLASRNFKAYDNWRAGREPIDTLDVDWYQYDENSSIPYIFVRDPGEGNPLGKMKFIFPNRFAVYMHDTPNKALFKNSIRAYSHGCIRLHQPQKLLEFVSSRYSAESMLRIQKVLEEGKNESVGLTRKIPVHIRYYTSWLGKNGEVEFRKDVYGYDPIFRQIIKNSD